MKTARSLVVLGALGVLSVAGQGCKGKPHTPAPGVAFSEASTQLSAGRAQPKICAGQANNKEFSVVGYVRWANGLVAGKDPLGGGDVAFMTLVPQRNATDKDESIAFRMPIGSDGVDAPELDNTKTETKGFGRGATTKTTGTVSDDTIKIHLYGGVTATNKTKLRVSLKVEGNNGACNLVYVGAVEEK